MGHTAVSVAYKFGNMELKRITVIFKLNKFFNDVCDYYTSA